MRIHNFRSILKGTLMAKFDLELVSGMIVPCAVLRRSDNGVPFVAADSRTDWTGDQVACYRFINKDIARNFQLQAMKAARPYIDKLSPRPAPVEHVSVADYMASPDYAKSVNAAKAADMSKKQYKKKDKLSPLEVVENAHSVKDPPGPKKKISLKALRNRTAI